MKRNLLKHACIELHWRMKHRKENQLLNWPTLKGFKNLQIQNRHHFIKFTAETRSSGIDHANGIKIRKGAFDAIRNMVEKAGNTIPAETDERVKADCSKWRNSIGSTVNNDNARV